MVAVRWHNGLMDAAPTWDLLFERVHGAKWNRGFDEHEFRVQLARRAYVWCGEPVVHPDAPPQQIFAELEKAGLVTIIDTEEEAS